jgi:Ca2+-binding RTX toxin-like protein
VAGAQAPNPVQGADGKKWRQLYQTLGMTPAQVAQVCPRDGVTRCSGSVGTNDLTGWIWGTQDQVVQLMGHYVPEILTANPPAAGDFFTANGFLADMRWTFYVSLYGAYHEYTAGYTASVDEAGAPVVGHVGYGWWPPSGGFSVLPSTQVDYYRGIWLWRPVEDDLTAPVITPTVTGTAGANGWYVSDVEVSFAVSDPETEISSQSGCDSATVTADTAGTTFTCTATSGGGTTTRTVTVLRDSTPPTVTCPSPPPVFELYKLGVFVVGTVTDATSGASPSPPAQGAVNTQTVGTRLSNVTGSDRAGNRTTVQCAYQVAVPTCNGLTPTHVGTALNDTINGTAGRDVIVGMGGADTINGNGGDDVICGMDGPDLIYGGAGNDWIDGGASPDDLNGGNGNDFLDGGLHNDSARGDSGTDTCVSAETRRSSCEL